MKGPTRPAPSLPPLNGVNRYSPVTNWQDNPFGVDVFEPTPQYAQKKKPPPRPPPPKMSRQPEVPAKPSHFIRKPTVLSSLLSRKRPTANSNGSVVSEVQKTVLTDISSEVDTTKMFPKCEMRNVQTGALIDLSSPPSSPTFTTRSSSDGLSVDSFGSDATTSTNQHNLYGGNISQSESGFEDDFDLFLSNKRNVQREDTLNDLMLADPFSPQPTAQKPVVMKKPGLSRDPYDLTSNTQAYAVLKGPTIIRAKPARPKPPENSVVFKSTLVSSTPITSMNVNTTVPIQKISNGFGENYESKLFSWEDDTMSGRESSPPMPTIPPPPPPLVNNEDLDEWPEDAQEFLAENLLDVPDISDSAPQAVALFDYFTNHKEDLCFSAKSIIYLIRRVNEEWLYGRSSNGLEGLFPSNYVDIKVPLPNETVPKPSLGVATAIYDFEPVQLEDLRFTAGDTIRVMHKLNDEWYFGECNGLKGQFPSNYVRMS